MTITLLTCISLHGHSPSPSKHNHVLASTEPSQKHVPADAAHNPLALHPAPRPRPHTPKRPSPVHSHQLLHHMVYPATLLCHRHQPPALRTPTPSQHQAPITFPAMPSTHPSPLKYPSPAFHQPILPRASAIADLARYSQKIILPRQIITSPGARARALSSLVNMRHQS